MRQTAPNLAQQTPASRIIPLHHVVDAFKDVHNVHCSETAVSIIDYVTLFLFCIKKSGCVYSVPSGFPSVWPPSLPEGTV